jgi:hypothetical protein
MEERASNWRVPATWVTILDPGGVLAYFKLDAHGDLIWDNGVLVPDHFVDLRYEKPLYIQPAYESSRSC